MDILVLTIVVGGDGAYLKVCVNVTTAGLGLPVPTQNVLSVLHGQTTFQLPMSLIIRQNAPIEAPAIERRALVSVMLDSKAKHAND